MGSALLIVCLTGCASLQPLETVPATPVGPGTEPIVDALPAPPPPPAPEPRVHIVARGETLTAIARRHGVPLERLVEDNRLADPDRLEVGQQLRLGEIPTPSAPASRTSATSLSWPVEGGHVLSAFGAPRGGRSHTGVDIGGKAGQPVLAAGDGVVVFTGPLRGYGNTVILDHGDGLRSLYAHNREIAVSEGETVEKGATIARVGRSGNATTDHCHFEVRQGEVPLDPLPLLSQAGDRP
jgi:murein DD-endopeptidase MepM/ murein hydrolase activator NlpD